VSLSMLTDLRLGDLHLTTAQQRSAGQNLPSDLYAYTQLSIPTFPELNDEIGYETCDNTTSSSSVSASRSFKSFVIRKISEVLISDLPQFLHWRGDLIRYMVHYCCHEYDSICSSEHSFIFGHYLSSCLLFKTQPFGEGILSPFSDETYSGGSNR
jgi:hypothetical protein